MLIIPLSTDASYAANMLCDQHLRWMPRHISLILASALHKKGVEVYMDDKKLTPNHPWSIWASESLDNFWWLADFGKNICIEYSIRYGKSEHADETDISHFYSMARMQEDWVEGFTPFPLVMPEKYKSGNAIESYRLYYLNKVIRDFPASYKKCGKMSGWWKELVDKCI